MLTRLGLKSLLGPLWSMKLLKLLRVFVGTKTISLDLSRMTCPLVQASVITIQIIGLILALHTERTTFSLSTGQPGLLSSLFPSVKLSQLGGQTSGYQS